MPIDQFSFNEMSFFMNDKPHSESFVVEGDKIRGDVYRGKKEAVAKEIASDEPVEDQKKYVDRLMGRLSEITVPGRGVFTINPFPDNPPFIPLRAFIDGGRESFANRQSGAVAGYNFAEKHKVLFVIQNMEMLDALENYLNLITLGDGPIQEIGAATEKTGPMKPLDRGKKNSKDPGRKKNDEGEK